MLTEMQNQDPTAPISSSDYASQLAQYTQISNQQATNDTLTSIESLLKGSASNSDLSYLNTDIKVNSPTAPVQDGQASWNYDVTGSPASVTLTVTNASGTVISQTSGDASAGAHDFTLPNQSDGQNLTLTVTAADAKGNALTSNVSSYATVTGVDQSGSAPKLIAGSSEYSSSDVTQVSEASSAATQSAATQNAA
jgi:flagellar basal-body rod modification protein FlgD